MASYKEFFKQHPTLLLTACYFVITIIGIVYSYLYYMAFEINIIKFADLSDFLLASILEPLSLLIFIGMVIFAMFIYSIDYYFRRRFPSYKRMNQKVFKSNYTDPIAFLFIVFSATYGLLELIAEHNARAIKQGQVDEFQVDFNDNAVKTNRYALLGSTSRYVYLYDSTKNQSMIVPVENVGMLKKNLNVINKDKTQKTNKQ